MQKINLTHLMISDLHTCTRCGKCLAACSFFQFYRKETHSPRGRIVLYERGFTPDNLLCFGCRKCEEACPFSLSPMKFSRCEDYSIREKMGKDEKAFFDLIYGNEKVKAQAEDYFRGRTLSIPLHHAWCEQNNLSTECCSKQSPPFFENRLLFNPYTDTTMKILQEEP